MTRTEMMMTMRRFLLGLLLLASLGLIWDALPFYATADSMFESAPESATAADPNLATATFAGGCFWCTESEVRGIPGVLYTVVGYTGGKTDSPTYQDITTGRTGHAEALEIYYDPAKTSYADIVDYFLRYAHNPTELNKQWVDEGTQYRSAIFYHNDEQKRIATDIIEKIDAEGFFKKPIVTTLEPLEKFWTAEDYHQQYYDKYRERTGRDHIRVLQKPKREKAN